MEEQRFRFFLRELADKLKTSDVDKMKYLCSDTIEAGALDEISARDLFALLQNRNLIQPSNISFLIQLLDDCDRKDLVAQAKAELNSDVVPESGVASNQMMSSHNSPHRVFLKQLSDELTSSNLDDFKFLINIPGMYPYTLWQVSRKGLHYNNCTTSASFAFMISSMRLVTFKVFFTVKVLRNDTVNYLCEQSKIYYSQMGYLFLIYER